VLINFIEHDIDRPIVTGVIHNGTHNPPTFSDAGSLPANKTLSGIKTKEYQGSRYNELLFDDTTNETRAKLSTEHGKTQLNQGYLIHPRTEGKGEPRGEGFELRTDDAGAIRSAKGLILSTDARPSASGKQLDRQEALGQLTSALELANTLSDTAEHQLANKTETGKQNQLIEGDKQAGKSSKSGHQQHLRDAVEGPDRGSNTDKDRQRGAPSPLAGEGGGEGAQGGGQPLILMSAPAGIGLATPNSTTIATGTNLDQVASRDTNQTTGRRWVHNVGESISLFVAGSKSAIKETLKLIAAKGKVQIQAQSDEMEVTADKDLKLSSVTQNITAAAKDGIVVTSGGGYARIKGGNIDIHCPGTLEIKAANIVLSGPGTMNVPMPHMPSSSLEAAKEKFSVRVDAAELFNDLKEAPGTAYLLKRADGSLIKGQLDQYGRTQRLYTEKPEEVTLLVGEGDWEILEGPEYD
jgi:type VI secretion system secreted protein VgrG